MKTGILHSNIYIYILDACGNVAVNLPLIWFLFILQDLKT